MIPKKTSPQCLKLFWCLLSDKRLRTCRVTDLLNVCSELTIMGKHIVCIPR